MFHAKKSYVTSLNHPSHNLKIHLCHTIVQLEGEGTIQWFWERWRLLGVWKNALLEILKNCTVSNAISCFLSIVLLYFVHSKILRNKIYCYCLLLLSFHKTYFLHMSKIWGPYFVRPIFFVCIFGGPHPPEPQHPCSTYTAKLSPR